MNKYYLIDETRLVRETSNKCEEYRSFEWKEMDDQYEILSRRNGVDISELNDSTYSIGNTSIMDSIKEISEAEANDYMTKYERAYQLHKSGYFNFMLYDVEKEFLKRMDYSIDYDDLFTPIENRVSLPIDELHDFLLDDSQGGNLDFTLDDFKICDRIMYLIQQFDIIYQEGGYVDFEGKLGELLKEQDYAEREDGDIRWSLLIQMANKNIKNYKGLSKEEAKHLDAIFEEKNDYKKKHGKYPIYDCSEIE